jgi:SAM-dependent methyltransferase
MISDGSLHKADFGAIYDQPDPRAYFLTLEPFDYVIPQHGAELFARLLRARATADTRRPRVLDVCCSYGVVATLMKTELELADIYAHYREAGRQDLTSEHLVDEDRRLLQEHPRPGSPTVIGLDVAPNAVGYALATGALDAGVVENLEEDPPSAELGALMSEVDLITTTGGVGYVTEKTFDRLLVVAPDSVWVAAFCLRAYDYSPISEALRTHGLQTERLLQTFPQRRFTGPEEERWAVAEVRKRGIDPAGKESEGYYHAEFYLSRPASEVERQPLAQLLPELHGSRP